MAKKSRRARTVNRATAPAQSPAGRQSRPAATSAARKTSAAVAAFVQTPANYDYVKSDLVRIGIIAGALIIITVVLTFVPALR